ncbi:serine/threonine-protein kinase [Nonomuraea sp. NPDC003804]|uniref:serine/threonine-protein kinase n=1 Tax=Nonomuraea sp. NPDC003804 TaxID=3154547 RepID=UPI0033A1220F
MGSPLTSDDPVSIGPYRLESRLGSGGMGTVYFAQAPDGAKVAVKAIRRDFAADPVYRARFHEEVSNARRVASFCTARVLDHGDDDGLLYLVTEYIDGVSLEDHLIQHGALSPSVLHSAAVGVAAALTAIHAAGLVHRDLKPANVMLTLAGPRVIDFGLARSTQMGSRHTNVGLVMGTPGWIAPEQVFEGRTSPAADVFAWGSLIAYAGLGGHPFGSGDAYVMAARARTAPPDLRGLPAPLDRLVAAAIHPDPARRPQARDLLLELVGAPDVAGAQLAATRHLTNSWNPADVGVHQPPPGWAPPPGAGAPPGGRSPQGPHARAPHPAGPERQPRPPAPQGDDPRLRPPGPPGPPVDDRRPGAPVPPGPPLDDRRSGPPGPPGPPVDDRRSGPPVDHRRAGPPVPPVPPAETTIPPTRRGPIPHGANPAETTGPGSLAAYHGTGQGPRPPYHTTGQGPLPRPRARRGGVLTGCLVAAAVVVGLALLLIALIAWIFKPPAIGAEGPVQDGKLRFTVTGHTCAKAARSAAVRRCKVTLKVSNIGQEGRVLYPGQQKLLDDDAVSHGATTLLDKAGEQIQPIRIGPGESFTGGLVFELPKAADPAEVELHDSGLSRGVRVPLD